MMYVEIEYDPAESRIFGRWKAWVRAENGWPLGLTSSWSRESAERRGRKLLAKHQIPKPAKYRLDDGRPTPRLRSPARRP